MTGPPLTARQIEALAAVRRLHAATGLPVGAGALATALGISKGPASLNLAHLWGAGYVRTGGRRGSGWRYVPAGDLTPAPQPVLGVRARRTRARVVAAVAALSADERPLIAREVAPLAGISRHTAGHWLTRLRAEGVLPPPSPECRGQSGATLAAIRRRKAAAGETEHAIRRAREAYTPRVCRCHAPESP